MLPRPRGNEYLGISLGVCRNGRRFVHNLQLPEGKRKRKKEGGQKKVFPCLQVWFDKDSLRPLAHKVLRLPATASTWIGAVDVQIVLKCLDIQFSSSSFFSFSFFFFFSSFFFFFSFFFFNWKIDTS